MDKDQSRSESRERHFPTDETTNLTGRSTRQHVFGNRRYILLIVPDLSVLSFSLHSLIYVNQFDLYLMMTIKMRGMINNEVILKRKRLLCAERNNIIGTVEYYAIV